MSNFTLTISNKKLYDFYTNNPHISFETVNLCFHDILVKLTDNMSSAMQSTAIGEILSSVQEQDTNMTELKNKLGFMTEHVSQIKQDTTNIVSKVENINDVKIQLNSILHNINTLKTDINNNLSVKFIDFKNDYITSVKSILNEKHNGEQNNIMTLIESNNDKFIDKTKLLLNDTLTKDILEYNRSISSMIDNNNNSFVDKTKILFSEGQDKYKGHIDTTMKQFQTAMTTEIKTLLKTDNNEYENLSEFVKSFDNKCTVLFQTIQQPVYNMLQASEERIQTNLTTIKDNAVSTQFKYESTMDDLSTYLKKFNNSSIKGGFGETELENVLNKIYPSSEVINCSTIKASGDFVLKRDNKNNIMMENKVYERNVNPDEVDKFIRDANETKTHSIFLSQNSGISRKKNFQIDFHDGLVLVYIHCVKYSQEKIQLAIDIIDNLSDRLDDLNCDDGDNVINKMTLDEINNEYISFTKQTDEIILLSKDYNKRLISNVENLRLNTLNKYLSTKYATNNKAGYTCEYCNVFNANNKKSLSAHARACKKLKGSICEVVTGTTD